MRTGGGAGLVSCTSLNIGDGTPPCEVMRISPAPRAKTDLPKWSGQELSAPLTQNKEMLLAAEILSRLRSTWVHNQPKITRLFLFYKLSSLYWKLIDKFLFVHEILN